MTMTEHEAALVTGALERTLSAEEERELDALLAARPGLREELESMRTVREVTMGLEFRKPPEEMWSRYWAGVYARLERGIAWLLISVGAAVLLALAAYRAVESLLADATMPLAMKLALGALALGAAVLLVSVVREKWVLRKTDAYREVIR